MPGSSSWDPLDRTILEGFARGDTLRWNEQPIELRAGKHSHVYVSARGELTDDPELLWPLGYKIALTVQNDQDLEGDTRPPCFVGIPTAGTPLAVAASLAAFRERIYQDAGSRVMYDARKLHGNDRRWLAGEPIDVATRSIWLLDNTVTDAQTKREALTRLGRDGYKPADISALVLIDRQQGGLEAMQQMGFRRVVALYSVLDIAAEFERIGHWSRARVRAVKEEIN